jgi:hypothetical protein
LNIKCKILAIKKYLKKSCIGLTYYEDSKFEKIKTKKVFDNNDLYIINSIYNRIRSPGMVFSGGPGVNIE